MIEGSRARLAAALRNGAIDIAIVTGETHLPHTKSMSLWSERILVVLPDGHRLAANEIVLCAACSRVSSCVGNSTLARSTHYLVPNVRPNGGADR
jgi:DNA-binding transcriptional LysR family regulator